MILSVFSIRDNAADAFIPPFFMPNEAVAVRVFVSCASDPNHQFSKFPKDYSLYMLGQWDDADGRFQMFPEPKFVANAATLLSGKLPIAEEV